MKFFGKTFVRVREGIRRTARGQTMTEYAFIILAIAIVVIAGYQLLGQDISSSVNNVNTILLSSAS
jgi:Flp pilus assembly pilin Flp